MAPIQFGGQQYDSVEAMPPDVRTAYEAVRETFADRNQDGIPDIFQGTKSPPDVRAVYEQAAAAAGRAMTVVELRTTDADPVVKAGPAGMSMLWLGMLVIIGSFIAAVLLASDGAAQLLAPFFPDRAVPEWGQVVGFLVFIVPGTILMLGALLWLIRRTTLGDPGMQRQLAENGETAEAVVIRLSDTGTTINENPLVKLLLEVRPRTRPAYRAETQLLISRLSIPQVQPGAVLAVRIDPGDPRKLMFTDFS